MEVATKVTPIENQASSMISPQVLPYSSLPYSQPCHNDNKDPNELMYLRPTNEITGPIWSLTPQGQVLVEEVVVAALRLYTDTSTTKVIVAYAVAT